MNILHSKIIGEGTPLLILHGFLGMSDNWKTLGNQFAKDGFQVHLIDQRNHGRSFHSDTFSYEALTKDISVYCKHYQLNNIAIIGHSMGGKTAMNFAVHFPENTSKLLVADISPKQYPVHHQTILDGLNYLDFNILKTRGEADKALSKFIPEIGVRQFLLKNLYWKEKGILDFRFNLKTLSNTINNIGESLADKTIFNKETLFLKGSNSDYIKEEDTQRIKQHFPKANIDSIPNAGHWLHAENPTAFYQKAIVFLK